jgi:DhnA family fructose-bisphosphate aldolase class Ia
MSEEQMYTDIKIGCRILHELGADVIKTFYTKSFEQVVAGCPTPILALGGKRRGSDLDALKLARLQIDCGAAGIVFGRYVMQSKKSNDLQKALLDVVKNNVSPDEAARKYKL